MTKREVAPVEQHVHSFLEIVPFMAVSFISVLHWPQLLALFGIGKERPDWRIRRKHRPLPLGYTVAILSAQVLLEWLAYLEELARTLVARRSPAGRGGRHSVPGAAIQRIRSSWKGQSR